MMPFGGGTGRVGRSRMRLDEMDCADIMMKAVQRKRSRSIARRESFSGTEDDLRKFRDAVEANDKESKVLAADLQKDIDEYAVKVRQIRGDDPLKKSGNEENRNVIRTDNEDTNLEKLPVKEDKCALKTNSNNLGENQSDCVSTAKNINEGVKNAEHSHGDTKYSNGDKKNESQASGDFEQVTKPNELQNYNEPQEKSNHENLEKSLCRDDNGSKVNNIVTNEGETVSFDCEVKPGVSCTEEDKTVLYAKEDDNYEEKPDEEKPDEEKPDEEKPNEEKPTVVNEVQDPENCQVHEDEVVDKVQEDEIAPEKDCQVHEDFKEDIRDQENVLDNTAAPEEVFEVQENVENISPVPDKINDQFGDLMVDGDNLQSEIETTNENNAQATQENSTDQYQISQEPEPEPEVKVEGTHTGSYNEENGDEKLWTDSNSCAIETSVKTEDPIENKCKAKTHEVQITEVVSDQPQEVNFLSIVDRIKTDITTLKTLSKSGTNASVNVNSEEHELINRAEAANFEEKNILDGQKQLEASKNLDNQVKISKELSSHLINLSSANISEQLRKSCSNIVAMNQDFSKEFLLKKLEELLKQESKQVSEDLEGRREQLRETQASHKEDLRKMTERHKNELNTLNKQQAIKLNRIENLYLDEIEDTRKEIELLENEQQNVKPQNKIINDCIRSLQPC